MVDINDCMYPDCLIIADKHFGWRGCEHSCPHEETMRQEAEEKEVALMEAMWRRRGRKV